MSVDCGRSLEIGVFTVKEDSSEKNCFLGIFRHLERVQNCF